MPGLEQLSGIPPTWGPPRVPYTLTLVPEKGLLQISLCRGGVITNPLPESAALHGLLASSCSYRGQVPSVFKRFLSCLPDTLPKIKCLQGLNLWPSMEMEMSTSQELNTFPRSLAGRLRAQGCGFSSARAHYPLLKWLVWPCTG